MFRFKVDFVEGNGECKSVIIRAASARDAALQVEKLGRVKFMKPLFATRKSL